MVYHSVDRFRKDCSPQTSRSIDALFKSYIITRVKNQSGKVFVMGLVYIGIGHLVLSQISRAAGLNSVSFKACWLTSTERLEVNVLQTFVQSNELQISQILYPSKLHLIQGFQWFTRSTKQTGLGKPV